MGGPVFDPESAREERARRREAREKRFELLEEVAAAVSRALEPLAAKVPSEDGGVTVHIDADFPGLDDITLHLDKNSVEDSFVDRVPF
jgi:hypothetical protein